MIQLGSWDPWLTAPEMFFLTFIAHKARARDELLKGCKKMFQSKGSLRAREVWEVSSSEFLVLIPSFGTSGRREVP